MTDNDELLKAYAALSKREERRRVAKAISVVKAARKEGLPVKAAVVEGVTLELGEPDAPKGATMTPLEAWKAKHARSA